MARKKTIPTECKVKARTRNGKTTYAYCFEGVETEGKRNQVEKGGFKSYEEAKKAGDAALFEYYRGSSPKSDIKVESLISVQDFINNIWFEERATLRNWLPATRANYRKQLDNYVIPTIGKMPISSVTPAMLSKILKDLYRGRHYSYIMIENLHSLIYSIFRYAQDYRYIDEFKFDYFVVPKPDKDVAGPGKGKKNSVNKQKRDIIPSENIKNIFERFPEGSSQYLIMAICLYTGARLGEAAALTEEECDFDNNLITICRQFPDGATTFVTNPKYDSYRVVPMCPKLKEILLRAIEKNRKNEKIWGENYQHTYMVKRPDTEEYSNVHGVYDINYEKGDEVHFINLKNNGQYVTPNAMKYASRIIHGYSSDPKEAKGTPIYDKFNTHSLRHTFVSYLDDAKLPNGVPAVSDTVKSAVLGHKRKVEEGASETTNGYIHVTTEQIQELNSIINEIF